VKSEGFAVAVEPSTYITVALDDPETAIEGILDTDRSYWNECIGTWIHNGQFHIDPVAIYYSPTIARSMAIHYEQDAYYDLEKGETVYV
jgi:hypothetical protein